MATIDATLVRMRNFEDGEADSIDRLSSRRRERFGVPRLLSIRGSECQTQT